MYIENMRASSFIKQALLSMKGQRDRNAMEHQQWTVQYYTSFRQGPRTERPQKLLTSTASVKTDSTEIFSTLIKRYRIKVLLAAQGTLSKTDFILGNYFKTNKYNRIKWFFSYIFILQWSRDIQKLLGYLEMVECNLNNQ